MTFQIFGQVPGNFCAHSVPRLDKNDLMINFAVRYKFSILAQLVTKNLVMNSTILILCILT